MSSTKANLKSAREAIGAKKFDEALKYCQRPGLSWRGAPKSGRSGGGRRRLQEGHRFEQSATACGLAKFYEKKENWSELVDTLEQMLTIYQEGDDAKMLLDTINKLIDIYTNKQKDRAKLVQKLRLLLPSSPCFSMLSSSTDIKLPAPLDTWLEITRLQEAEDAEMITREIEARRRRLNAGPLATIKAQVQNEVYSASQLGEAYEHILTLAKNSPSSVVDVADVQRKYLEFLQRKLAFSKEKDGLREKLYELAQSLVDQGGDSPTPYEMVIEATDAASPGMSQNECARIKICYDYDQELLELYTSKFPETGLSKLIQGRKLYIEEGNAEDALDLFADGLEQCPSSLFGYQSLSWLYHDQRDYESGLEYATKGRDLVQQSVAELGRLLDRTLLSMELCMASCYRNLEPKYHPDAMAIYTKILDKFPDNIQALQGAGLILAAQKKYDEAIRRFQCVLELDPSNHAAKAELGSIECELGHHDRAIEYLTEAIEMWGGSAVYYHRLGKVYWAMGGDYNTDKDYAYKQFIQAAKLDPHFAAAFTYLGHYYRIVEHDRLRAKRCYQKAFSLDPSDADSGIQLSDYYVEDEELDLAEAVFRTATKVNARTGWAWKRLGFAELIKGNHLDAITDFQTALRTDTKDINCWEGLAEAYQHEGRYMASMRAFSRAKELDPTSVHVNYQIALVKHKLGLLDEAVEQYRLTLDIARENGAPDYLPALKGLAETHLALTKESFQLGFYGRVADASGQVLEIIYRAIQVDRDVQCFWKLVGDACLAYRIVPNFVRLCPLDVLQAIINIASERQDIDAKLHFPSDCCSELVGQFLAIDLSQQDIASLLPTKEILNVLTSCSTLVYKYAVLLSGNNPEVAPAYWYDLGIAYFAMRENNSHDIAGANGSKKDFVSSDGYLTTAIRCVKAALKFEPSNFTFWNTLGVMTTAVNPKISQHALIKAMELNPRSVVPWTNLGYLYLSRLDLELANQAFSTSQSLDPDWVPAWVGQACVATLWGNSEGGELFEHAFSTSGGAVLEADYGYASAAFNQAAASTANTSGGLLVSPAFALQKYTEQKPEDPTALNLLGLVLERLERYGRAAEAFASAVLSLESQLEQGVATIELVKPRLAKVHANLARVLCASGDFAGSIASYTTSLEMTADGSTDAFRIYCHLGAGIAYYFDGQLENSLQMFEIALSETDVEGDAVGLADVRKDVVVLLSQVLWALGTDEHRDLAKAELFRWFVLQKSMLRGWTRVDILIRILCRLSIAQNPTHLPAIFCLCVMGLLQDDATLATAALREMLIPADVADELDRDGNIGLLFSKFFQLQGADSAATVSFTKSVHQMPTNPALWSRLARHLTTQATSSRTSTSAVSASTATLFLLSSQDDVSSIAKAKAYQNLAAALMNQHEQEKRQKNVEAEPVDVRKNAVMAAQRAVMTAPWDMDGWVVLAVAQRMTKEPAF
ncbi:hypothetical protein BC936DRAFT_145426 [Jimgerdemannia flammicorona]|uniref:TPR-like protein n=1 Tax=Jimgerdemannia flammicorona TaxID=994334 RepID=A0A433DA34_9FUNG|nr:hypothetical protein BC936DRAFT_145426 [Jimgerdemannia flammicorona]